MLRHLRHKIAHNFRDSIVALILFIYVGFNIVASQTISPLYIQIFNNEKSGIIQFLQKIRPLPEFLTFFQIQSAIYGKEIKNEVFAETKENNYLINKYQKLLKKNPNSRDLLYSLSLLYSRNGEGEKSKWYLQKAQVQDPSVK